MLDIVTPPVLARTAPEVVFDRVSLAFDERVVLENISFTVPSGHMLILLGASGVGKSVILRLILGLLKPDSGTVSVGGQRIDAMDEAALMEVRTGIGMLFQESALFDSISVAENVGYSLAETTDLTPGEIRERVEEVLGFLGMTEYADRLPSELSGGQRRRVAVARAMAARPGLLLFDEPTSGLDPITARTVDDEIVKARDVQRSTTLLVTHQLRDALYIATHRAEVVDGAISVVPADAAHPVHAVFIMLRDARIYFTGTAAELRASPDSYLRAFLG